MSYILKIVVPTVPPYNHEAYSFADELIEASKGVAPSLRLLQLHEAITARFPCASSGAYANAAMGECPWGAGVLLDGFHGDVAVLSIAARNVEIIPFLLRRAGALALTVVDEQAAKVHRPATFRVVLSAVRKDVITRDLSTKLVPLLKRTDEEVLTLLMTPNAILKRRMDHVTAQRFAETLGLIGCECNVEKELPEGAGLVVPVKPVFSEAPALTSAAANDVQHDAPVPAKPVSWVAKVLGKVGASRNEK